MRPSLSRARVVLPRHLVVKDEAFGGPSRPARALEAECMPPGPIYRHPVHAFQGITHVDVTLKRYRDPLLSPRSSLVETAERLSHADSFLEWWRRSDAVRCWKMR